MTLRVGFLTSHPIQYQVPVFRRLAEQRRHRLHGLLRASAGRASAGGRLRRPVRVGCPAAGGIRLPGAAQCGARAECDAVPGLRHAGCVRRDSAGDGWMRSIVNGWVVKSCLQGLRGLPATGDSVSGPGRGEQPAAAGVVEAGAAASAGASICGVPVHRRGESPVLSCSMGWLRSGCSRPRTVWTISGSSQPPEGSIVKRPGSDWAWQSTDCVFVFCGKLEPKKHPLELIASFGAFRERGGVGQLLMVGDGPLRPIVRAARAGTGSGRNR